MLVICLEERLAYRTDFALGTVMRFLPIVTQVFLWTAVFSASERRTDIAGYSRDNIVAYYLLTMVNSSLLKYAESGRWYLSQYSRWIREEISNSAG